MVRAGYKFQLVGVGYQRQLSGHGRLAGVCSRGEGNEFRWNCSGVLDKTIIISNYHNNRSKLDWLRADTYIPRIRNKYVSKLA